VPHVAVAADVNPLQLFCASAFEISGHTSAVKDGKDQDDAKGWEMAGSCVPMAIFKHLSINKALFVSKPRNSNSDFVRSETDLVISMPDFVRLATDFVISTIDFARSDTEFVRKVIYFVISRTGFAISLNEFARSKADFVNSMIEFVRKATGLASWMADFANELK